MNNFINLSLALIMFYTFTSCTVINKYNSSTFKKKTLLKSAIKDTLIMLIDKYDFKEENKLFEKNKQFQNEVNISFEDNTTNDKYEYETRILKLLDSIQEFKLLNNKDLKQFGTFFIEKKYFWILRYNNNHHSIKTDNVSFWCDSKLCNIFVNLIKEDTNSRKNLFLINDNYIGDNVCIDKLIKRVNTNLIEYKKIKMLHTKILKIFKKHKIKCYHYFNKL